MKKKICNYTNMPFSYSDSYHSNKYKDSKTNQYKSEYIRTICYKGKRWSNTEDR